MSFTLHAGQPVFGRQWIPSTAELGTATAAAQVFIRLMQPEPSYSDHPTPTPTQWAAITAAASKALVALHWHRDHAGGFKEPEGSVLRGLLRHVSHELLIGHMRNLELDVQQVLRYMLLLQQLVLLVSQCDLTDIQDDCCPVCCAGQTSACWSHLSLFPTKHSAADENGDIPSCHLCCMNALLRCT